MRLTFTSRDSAPSVQQTSHKLLREALRTVLRALVRTGYRRCRVHIDVDFWLHQPDTGVLPAHLRNELRRPPPESSSQTPAAAPPPVLPGGALRVQRPDPDHGGAGSHAPDAPPPPWPTRFPRPVEAAG